MDKYPELMEDDRETPEEEIIANRKIRLARLLENRLDILKINEDDCSWIDF